MNDKLGRRGFFERLKLGALALAGVGSGACVASVRRDPYAIDKEPVPGTTGWRAGEERSVLTTCGQCPAACGLRTRVVEARAVKLDGNPDSPVNRGGIGPKGQAGLQVLYHPDRIRGPVKRIGARGSADWKPVSWEDALAEIAAKLHRLRADGTPESLVVVDGQTRGLMHELWGRFLTAYGSPNHIGHESTGFGGKRLAVAYMQGGSDLPAYDWEQTGYVLGLGTSLFESWCQTMHLMRASSHLRHNIPGRRVKFVHVSPRLSRTSSRADEWVPINPATYGAFALGLAHVLCRDGLHDATFVRDHTFGFEDWTDDKGERHRGFRALVEQYDPAKVAALTGVPKETTERVAREMAAFRPAIVVADGSAAAASNGLGTAMSIHALNALLGNLERPGGMLMQRRAPLAAWAPEVIDQAARAGLASPRIDGAGTPARPLAHTFVQALPEAILSGSPYPAKALFLYYSNPIFTKPDGKRWKEALEKVPLVVSFSPFADESSLWADYVLPDHTYLERWEPVEPAPSRGFPALALRQPVVAPLYHTAHTGDVVLKLAQALGGSVADALPWKDFREASEIRLAGLVKKETTSVETPPDDVEALIEAMQTKGGWWNEVARYEDWAAGFQTPSGKFEFYSRAIAKRLETLFPKREDLLARLAAAGQANVNAPDDLCLPTWSPPRLEGDPRSFPLVLLPFRAVNYAEGGVRHIPWLVELPIARGNGWREHVEMNPKDAMLLGLGEKDEVIVESPAGAGHFRLRLYAGVRPGTLALPLGHGAWPPGPNDPPGSYSLIVNHSDPWAGILAIQGTRVRVRKAATT